MKETFKEEFTFVPYKSVGMLNFNESEEDIKLKLGVVQEEYENYGNNGKTLVFESCDNASIYLDSNNNLDGIHFFNSIKFNLNGKSYIIDFMKFTEENLKDISDDFKITANEEGVDYTSEKLGLDFYFNDEDDILEAVLFMNKEYYNNEIKNRS